MTIERIIFGAGCFWGVEATFRKINGVHNVTCGYSGGHTNEPNYNDVCTGTTGHVEVVQVEYESNQITFEQLLDVFWHCHDPTTLNRQGADIGTQYRSAVFYHDESQKHTVEQIITEMGDAQMFEQAIVTQVCPIDEFYSGEDYHQDYVNNNPENAYCQAVVSPKLAKFRKTFVSKLK